MKKLALILLGVVTVLTCAVRAADTLATRPIAAIAVMHCNAITAIWIVEPTRVTRYDAEHPPADRNAVIAQMNAAIYQDAIDVNCTPHPVDTGVRK